MTSNLQWKVKAKPIRLEVIMTEVSGKQHSTCSVERKIGSITYVVTTEQSLTATETLREKMTKIILGTARNEMKKLSESTPQNL